MLDAPKTPRTSLLAMEQAWFEVRASRRACMRMKVFIWTILVDSTYALLSPHSRLTRLLRAPLIQKERFSYICMRIKALSLMFFLQIYVFIRLYTMESVYLKGMLIKKHTYDYIRLYTFENASLQILKISSIRWYTNIYVCKRLFGSSWDFEYTFIYDYIRLGTHVWYFWNFKYTFIYDYIRFKT